MLRLRLITPADKTDEDRSRRSILLPRCLGRFRLSAVPGSRL